MVLDNPTALTYFMIPNPVRRACLILDPWRTDDHDCYARPMAQTLRTTVSLIRSAFLILCVLSLSSATVAEDVIHRGNRGEPDTLDPHKTANGWEASIAMELFMGLTAGGPKGQLLPGMAESWTVSDDGLTYIWTLREGLIWSDGEALTSADFVYSYRRLLDPATASSFASLLYPIKNAKAVNTGQVEVEALGIAAPDDLTVVMALEHPAPYLPQMLIHRGLPVPRHAVERHGVRWTRPENFVGNGAFTLAEWVPQSYVRLERNPAFFDAQSVQLDALYFHPTENLGTGITQFRAGELDVLPALPSDRLDWARENLPESLRVMSSLGVEYLVFNVAAEPVNDVRVRQALSMAVMRPVLVENFLKGGERAAYSLVHPDVISDEVEFKPQVLAGDDDARLAKARELLGEVGYDRANPLVLKVRFNNQDVVAATMDVVARMWSRLPVDVELIGSDTPTLYSDLRTGNFQVARAAWYPEAVDPSTYLYLLRSTSGPMNQSGYRNPAYDRALDLADQETDPARRLAYFREAEVIAGEDQPLAPLFYYSYRMLVHPRVGGWIDYNRSTHPGRFLFVQE